MLKVIINSIKDIFDRKIFFTSLLPIVIAALFWGVVFFIFHNQIDSFFVYLVSHMPFIGKKSWLQDTVEAVGLVFIYYQLMVITAVMIVGLIADRIVEKVNLKHYHLQKRGFGNAIGSTLISLKQNIIFVILFIILLPTMFVPILNIFVNIFLWMILIKKPMFYDSISMYATKEEYERLENSDKFSTFILSLISASLFLIPIFGFFVYILQLLIFTHFNLSRLKNLRFV